MTRKHPCSFPGFVSAIGYAKAAIRRAEGRAPVTHDSNPAAVKLGRLGGKAKAANMTPEERSAYAKRIASLPRSDDRCACRKMTKARAKARGHKCEEE
jgi:CxxC motif-containing protein (DUF1111 family)